MIDLQTMPLAAYVLLAVAHALDVHATCCSLAWGGHEANPIARWAMACARSAGAHPAAGLVLLKVAITALLWLCSASAAVVLGVAILTYIAAVWNYLLVRRAALPTGGRP